MSVTAERVARFKQIMQDEGELFVSTGSVEGDFDLIQSTINFQGYWSGGRYRYYFDEEFNLIKAEERRFGNGNR